MKITKGNFREFGARVSNDKIMFTLIKDTSTQNFSIKLFDIESTELFEEIILTEEYSIGNVYSILVSGVDYRKLCYLICQDEKEELDPYATSVVGRDKYNDDARSAFEYKVYSGFSKLDESDDSFLGIEPKDMIIYKVHMRGFTFGNKMAASRAGNYKGLLSKIPYFKKLNITSIEMMPVYDFEEMYFDTVQNFSNNGKTVFLNKSNGRVNYWGYGAASYFAPKSSYFGGAKDACVNFKKMVTELHKAQIECILEFSFSENISADYIIKCLLYYVRFFNVDGFHLIGLNVPVERIVNEPFLADTKLFFEYVPESILLAETGKKHVFVYDDSYMYVNRQIQNHMNGSLTQFANHMRRQNSAFGFVNYVANVCGFSLWDSYSYGEKHNWDNGEENRDGNNVNYSFNYGIEGKSNNKSINSNRYLQMRNGFAALLLAQAIPLIVAGDEVAATHNGNNNPYCQDNPVGYTMFVKNKNKSLLQKFVIDLIEFRKQHKCIHPENAFSMNDTKHLGLPDMSFHGSEPWTISVGDEQKSLGVLYYGAYADEKEEVYVCYNYSYEPVEMALPILTDKKRWRQIFNTKEYDENSSFEPSIINNQQSIIVPEASITVLVGMKV